MEQHRRAGGVETVWEAAAGAFAELLRLERSLAEQAAAMAAAGEHCTPGMLARYDRDLERFEREGRAKRWDGVRAPDSHSVSQVLRVIGAILDQKRGKMSYVSKDEQVVTIEYEHSGGRVGTEQYDVPTLYDFWVRMYKKRTARNGAARLTA